MGEVEQLFQEHGTRDSGGEGDASGSGNGGGGGGDDDDDVVVGMYSDAMRNLSLEDGGGGDAFSGGTTPAVVSKVGCCRAELNSFDTRFERLLVTNT